MPRIKYSHIHFVFVLVKIKEKYMVNIGQSMIGHEPKRNALVFKISYLYFHACSKVGIKNRSKFVLNPIKYRINNWMHTANEYLNVKFPSLA